MSNTLLQKIRVVPLAAESLGVRSMCAFVETPDVRVLLDAGVSLAPNRFGFPPHPLEYKAMRECRRRIREAAEKADVVTISHYHFDHHTPSYIDWCYNWSSAEVSQEIYLGKSVLMKSYRADVNFNQRRRGWMFVKTGGKDAKKLEVADGKTFRFGETKLKFSRPVYHGSEGTALGWVLMTCVHHGDESFLFAPDVQGPMYNPTLKIILTYRPRLLMIGGPPVYLAGFRVQEEKVRLGIRNLAELAENIPVIILEHHMLRDEKWRGFAKPVFDSASRADHRVFTAAEFLGVENKLLESQRRRLYEEQPPDAEFERWLKLPQPKRKLTPPPV